MPFTLHHRLAADTAPVCDLPLCAVLLMKDARFPWLILVPRRENISEIIDLAEQERAVLMKEIAQLSAVLKSLTHCDKLNVGALGNMVPQLHVHVVARFKDDPAWPGPVWGAGTAEAYALEAMDAFLERLCEALGAVCSASR